MNAAPVIAVAFGFVSVMVSSDAAFGATGETKDLAIVGCARTASVAVAAAALPALVVVTTPVLLR